MVSGLGSVYNDLLDKLPPELKERVNTKKLTHRDFLEIARSVIVKKEADGSISISSNELSEKEIRKIEVSKEQIELIRKICSTANETFADHKEKVGEKRKPEDLTKDGSAVSVKKQKVEGSVAIVRGKKRKAENEPDYDSDSKTKEIKRKKLLTPAERDQVAEEIKEVFLQNSIVPNAIKLTIADYIEEIPNVICDFENERRLPGYLKDIVDLDLGKEKLDFATFCHIIDDCKNLQSLTLPEYADDSWLEEIAKKLPNLINLYVYSCVNFTDVGLGAIATLSFLEKLVLNECDKITEQGIDLIIQKLEFLQKLDISAPFMSSASLIITDKAFENIGKRSETLISLKLSNFDKLTDNGVNKIITELSNLQELSLNLDGISDEGLINISRLHNSLKELELYRKFTGMFLSHIDQTFKVLKNFRLRYCSNFEESNFTYCNGKFPALETLELSGIKGLTYVGIGNLVQGARQIEFIKLDDCEDIDDKALQRIAEECPNLKEFSIYSNNRLSGSGLDSIFRRCSDLVAVYLSHCGAIDDSGLKSLSEHYHKLKNLDLIYCENITDEGLRNISLVCPDLIRINISGCAKITDLGIQYLSQRLKSLEYLKIAACKKITPAGFSFISEWKESLQMLDVDDCKIDDTVFTNFESNFPLLHTITLSNCKDISDASLNRISQLFPSLEELYLPSCENITNDGISCLNVLSKLSKLSLRFCRKITSEVVDHLMVIPNLRTVDLFPSSLSQSDINKLKDRDIIVI